MTTFRFNLFNHSPVGRESVEDIIDPIAAQMLDLGHDAHRDDSCFLPPPVVNVMVEGFNAEINALIAAARAQEGIRLVIIATERPSTHGFNNQTKGEMVTRQVHFPAAAAQADALWPLVPEAVEWMQRHHKRVAHLELGYSARRIIPQVGPAEYDFGFFGSLTPRRQGVLQDLVRRGHRVFVTGPRIGKGGQLELPSREERNELMQRCKIILQLKPADNWQIISSSRCNTAINLGRAVVAEPHNSNSAWKRIVRFSSTPFNFVKTAEKALEDYEGEWVRQFCRFKEILPPAACVGKVIEETLQ